MALLSIRVLGPFQVSLDGETVSGLASDKVRALLAHLALSPDRPHRRGALAGLLWPEFPERSARTNLRNALAYLRHVLGDHARSRYGAASPPFLHSTRQTIHFNGQSDHWLDAPAFEDLLTPLPPTTEGWSKPSAWYVACSSKALLWPTLPLSRNGCSSVASTSPAE